MEVSPDPCRLIGEMMDEREVAAFNAQYPQFLEGRR